MTAGNLFTVRWNISCVAVDSGTDMTRTASHTLNSINLCLYSLLQTDTVLRKCVPKFTANTKWKGGTNIFGIHLDHFLVHSFNW